MAWGVSRAIVSDVSDSECGGRGSCEHSGRKAGGDNLVGGDKGEG